jgi:NADP-dependent 3-hydroxy acid dehydrogenase YdfG
MLCTPPNPTIGETSAGCRFQLRLSAWLSSYSSLESATKHALKGFADALRQEVNPKGVRVISVYPGRTATPLQAWVSQVEGRPYISENLLQPEDVAEIVVNAIALPDTPEVTDITIRPAKKHPIA